MQVIEYVFVPGEGVTASDPVVVATDEPPGTAEPLSVILQEAAFVHDQESVDCSGGTTVEGLAAKDEQFGTTTVTVEFAVAPLPVSLIVTGYVPGAPYEGEYVEPLPVEGVAPGDDHVYEPEPPVPESVVDEPTGIVTGGGGMMESGAWTVK